ncbi:hypothetical protein [Arenicella xantha]|uniref:Uncharacterized protein n=1 Tax=Arenicella xantha TaxID=644221 RepID=A0A395JJM6_9GAMM|nr:hypothetical protein [Arenicella xantha]RBP50891.1 hypothetical protein DFR28_102307 [Arenicella xantha]
MQIPSSNLTSDLGARHRPSPMTQKAHGEIARRSLIAVVISLQCISPCWSAEAAQAKPLKATELAETPIELDDTTRKIDELDELEEPLESKEDNGCKQRTESRVWVDRLRADTHTRLCNTASWVDGLFGDEQPFKGENFRGKVAVGFRHDEIEGIDPRVRIRIRTDLPNMDNRLNAFVGRVEEDSYISNTEVSEDRLNNVGLRSTNDDDSEWLVGLGYRSPTRDSSGWDFSVGAKLSGGLSPYSRLTYRQVFQTGEDQFWKTEQTGFWRKQDGFGVSSNVDYTRMFGEKDIMVLNGSVKYTEEAEQWEWFTDATWHHSITDKRGVSSSVYARGEEENPVSLPEYGVTFTYIQPIMRDWVFIETGVDFRWEREYPGQSYQGAINLGIQFEMLLGDYYRRRR